MASRGVLVEIGVDVSRVVDVFARLELAGVALVLFRWAAARRWQA